DTPLYIVARRAQLRRAELLAVVARARDCTVQLVYRILQRIGDMGSLDAGRVEQLHQPLLGPFAGFRGTMRAQPDEFDHELLLLGRQGAASLEDTFSELRGHRQPSPRLRRSWSSVPISGSSGGRRAAEPSIPTPRRG